MRQKLRWARSQVREGAGEGPGVELLGLGGKEGVVSLAPGERGGAKPTPLSPLSPPPPGLFPRKLYQCGHARRRHLGRLVSRGRARKRVFPAWPLAAAEPLVALPPACGGSGRLPASPSGACGAPRTGWFLLLGHILSRRRSAPSLRTLTPPPNTSAGGGGGGGWSGRRSSGPFNRVLETAST